MGFLEMGPIKLVFYVCFFPGPFQSSSHSILSAPALPGPPSPPQAMEILSVSSLGSRSILPVAITPSSALRMTPRLSVLPTQSYNVELETKKNHLLMAVQDSQRGLLTTSDQRFSIEQALVDVEAYAVGAPIHLSNLDGTWRLHYTSAPDVLILFQAAASLPFFQVGQIFQKFECRDQSSSGVVRNVVQWSIPTLLEEQDGATLLVSANFSVVSARNIYLQFEEIKIQNFKIGEALQAIIAPAILPRSFLSLQILQFLRSFQAKFPVRNAESSRSVGGLYYLSYLDGNMLLGRAVGGGGVFVFTRTQPLLL